MQDPVSLNEKPDYALAEAGLRVKDGCFIKVDIHGNTISSIPLTDIDSMRCRRVFSFLTLLVAAVLIYLGRAAFLSSESMIVRWVIAPTFGLAGLAAFIGAFVEHELVVRTREGVLRFNLPVDSRDGQAFAATVMNEKRRPAQ